MSEAEKYYREIWCLTIEEHPILGKKHNEVIEMMEDFHNHMKQVKNNDLLHSVSHCSKGVLAEEFQKGYKEGYEDGANAAANDIAANPHKMY